MLRPAFTASENTTNVIFHNTHHVNAKVLNSFEALPLEALYCTYAETFGYYHRQTCA